MSVVRSLSDSAASLRTVDEFKLWTRRQLRRVLPHEAAIFGLGHLHAGGVGLDYLITIDYPLDHIESIRNRAGAIDTPMLRRWLATQQPQIFDAENPWPETPAAWLESVRRHRLRNALVHGMYDHKRCVGTYHSLWRMPSTPGAPEVELLCELLPMLHETVFRIVNALDERDRLTENFATLTEREREVVRWLRHGKTNAQIASQTGMSENTIKHYLTGIFDKLDVCNRAQLVRLLAEQEARQAPTSQTRVV
jgi:DNA-binding CsgD family transcriptional regulator